MRNFNEKTLVSKLDKILKKEFGTNLVFHEFSAGYGIADLVFAPNFSFSKRAIKHTPLTSFDSLSVFLELETEKIYHLEELINIFSYLKKTEVEKYIKLLVNYNYLTKIDNDKFKKILDNKFLSPIPKVIAIEAKLDDHKNGLIQARRYQYFADESYLAILKRAEKNINMEEFNRHNIGLILFNDEDNTIEIKYPKPENPVCNNSVSIFAKEIMLNRYLIS